MKITRKQIRKIVEEEIKRDLPISYYSDEMIMQEGLLDFLGNLFGKLVDFLFGDAEESRKQTYSSISSNANDAVSKAAKEADLEDVESIDDLDMKDEDHQKVFYAALAPAVVSVSEAALGSLKETEAVEDWTPADDSEEAAKKWEEENGEAAGGLYGAGGSMLGLLKFFGEHGMSSAEESYSSGEAALKEGPAQAAQWISQGAAKAITSIFEFAKSAGIDGADDAISAVGEVGSAGAAVAEKIAASGKDQSEEQKKESLELRRLINGLVLQERIRNI